MGKKKNKKKNIQKNISSTTWEFLAAELFLLLTIEILD